MKNKTKALGISVTYKTSTAFCSAFERITKYCLSIEDRCREVQISVECLSTGKMRRNFSTPIEDWLQIAKLY